MTDTNEINFDKLVEKLLSLLEAEDLENRFSSSDEETIRKAIKCVRLLKDGVENNSIPNPNAPPAAYYVARLHDRKVGDVHPVIFNSFNEAKRSAEHQVEKSTMRSAFGVLSLVASVSIPDPKVQWIEYKPR